MGSIISYCDDQKIIISDISIPKIPVQNNNSKQKELTLFIDLIKKYYIKICYQKLKNYHNNEKINENSSNILANKNKILSKNQLDINNQSNLDNLTLNSSINKKYNDNDTQIIENNNNNINSNILISNSSYIKNDSTPDGNNILINQNIKSVSPSENEPKSSNNKILKSKKNKKNNKSPTNHIEELTPIPEYPNLSLNYDKSMIPGHIILNFYEIPQEDKITEIENNIGGEFSIDQKEILKYMEEYPYIPKSFSISYPSGEKYSGYFGPNWVKEVFGIQIDKNGSKYVGMFKNGMFEGKGRLILHKGDYYEGEFVQNKANGQGKYVNNKGEIYNGFWKDDKQDGEGELILKDGSIYRGQFKNGKKNGKGKITWNDNSYYEGNFVNNYYEGYGVYIILSKRKGYIGEWKEGKMNGFGVFFWADGRSYVGYYESDKKHGYGIYSGKNNLRYEGKFRKGKQYGIGRIINEKGEKQLGLYVKGKKLKYLNEIDFKDDINILDEEIKKINNIFNNEEFFVKNKDLMNITLDQT